MHLRQHVLHANFAPFERFLPGTHARQAKNMQVLSIASAFLAFIISNHSCHHAMRATTAV